MLRLLKFICKNMAEAFCNNTFARVHWYFRKNGSVLGSFFSAVFAHMIAHLIVLIVCFFCCFFFTTGILTVLRLFYTYDMLSFILQRYDWGCSYQRQERSYSWTEIFTRWEFPSCWFQWQLCGYIWCCSAIQENWRMYWIFKFHHSYGLVFRQ